MSARVPDPAGGCDTVADRAVLSEKVRIKRDTRTLHLKYSSIDTLHNVLRMSNPKILNQCNVTHLKQSKSLWSIQNF